MEIRLESVTNLRDAVNHDYLIDNYALEGHNELYPKVKPNYDMYVGLENQGMLDFVGLYKGESLVGFIMILTVHLPHYTALSSTIESFFVLPKYRAYGTGKRLIRKAEAIAKEKGSEVLFMSAPKGGRLSRVSESMGFTETNTVYTRKIA